MAKVKKDDTTVMTNKNKKPIEKDIDNKVTNKPLINKDTKETIDDKIENTESDKKELDFDLNSTVSEIVARAPKVSEHVINAEPAKPSLDDDKSNSSQVIDDPNKIYNPTIHRAGKDNKGILNNNGTYAKKPGRKQGSTVSPSQVSIPSELSAEQQRIEGLKIQTDKQNEGFAMMAASMASMVRSGLGCNPASETELSFLATGIKTYLDSSEIVVSPAANLTIVTIGFFAPVVALPPDKNVLFKISKKLFKKKKPFKNPDLKIDKTASEQK